MNSNTQTRNYCLDFIKLLSSFAVVFIHCLFPNPVGNIIDALSRFAVPLFFITSGYFYYNTYKNCKIEKAKKNIFHVLKLSLFSFGLYFIETVLVKILSKSEDVSTFDILFSSKHIYYFLIFNNTNTSGHLWFLFALLYVYILMFVSLKLKVPIKSFYFLTAFIIPLNIFLTHFLPMFNINLFVKNYVLVRNWLMLGLPFFSAGMIIHENQQKLFTISKRKYIIIVLIGFFITFIERILLDKYGLYIGSIFVSIALFVWCLENHEFKFKDKYSLYVTKSSLLIYIFHPLVISILAVLNKFVNLNEIVIYNWVNPFLVCIISFFISIMFIFIFNHLKIHK